jgi:hypothetical protein
MSRGSINANVRHPADARAAREFSFRVQEIAADRHGFMLDFIRDFGMSAPAVYERLRDPDKWTVGQLRELRMTLGMNKADFLAALRPLL